MKTIKVLFVILISQFVALIPLYGEPTKQIVISQIVEHKDSIVIQLFDSTNNIISANTIKIKKNCQEVELTQALNRLVSLKLKNVEKLQAELISKWKLSIQEYEKLQKDSVDSRLKDIKGDNIGILYVKSKKVKACILQRNYFGIYSNENSSVNLEIDSVEIAFECGQIKDMIVKTKNSKNESYCFTNPNYFTVRNSQDFDRFSKKGEIFLINSISRDSILTLDFADVLYFNRKLSGPSGTYIPADTNIVVSPQYPIGVRLFKTSMINNMDLRVFTDVLGYNNQSNPNGIIQSEIQINFGLNQHSKRFTLSNAWDKESKRFLHSNYKSTFIWINRISPFIILSMIENSNKNLLINENQTKNLLDLFKYSNTNIGTELNVFVYKTDSKLFACNLGGGVLRTNVVKDSINSSNFNVSTAYINPNFNFQFFESNRIDFNVKISGYCAWLLSSIDKVLFSNPGHLIKDYISDGSHWWFEIGQSINLHPSGKKSSSIFIRASQFISTNNNHFTFQIGYATSIGKILKL